ncbi:unnamed protein product [Clavelina lepadiformis]|uniref:Centrosomal protein of 78 kDa n=1 Tax=Clavelina lepadiformis TaxID=159417 RepID=A0ABP0FGJ2_CLALP
MIPESVSVRQRGSYDFESCYDHLCALQGIVPLLFVKAHLKNALLDINGDKVKLVDWDPILNAIKINKSLQYVAVRSYYQPTANNGKRAHYFRRRTPVVRTKDITLRIARSIAACVARSTALRCIDLQGVPLRGKDLQILAKGIAKNQSLTHILFDYCQISDKGVEILCQALRSHPTVTHVSMTGCNITSTGANFIAKLIKHQSTLRHSEAWAESLRYRTPNLRLMGGIRRITLNSNPMIGDAGILSFNEALRDDLWLKALDFQHCGITTPGVHSLITAIEHNNTIVVLDVRRNPMVDSNTLRKLLRRVLVNANENDETEFPWVKEEVPKDPYKTGRYRHPRPVNRSLTKRFGKSQRLNRTSEGIPEVRPPGHESFVPWRTAVRASQHKYGFQEDDSDDNEEQSEILCLNKNQTVDSEQSLTFCSSTAVNEKLELEQESSLTQAESQVYIKRLKVDLLDSQRRLKASVENERRLNEQVMKLEIENAKLQKELSVSIENTRMHSQLEDELLLDSIETSFNKFHDFLNLLNEVGLGSLAKAAGLDGDFGLPGISGSKRGSNSQNNLLAKSLKPPVENETMQAQTPIIIKGNTSTNEKSGSVDENISESDLVVDTKPTELSRKVYEKDFVPAERILESGENSDEDF